MKKNYIAISFLLLIGMNWITLGSSLNIDDYVTIGSDAHFSITEYDEDLDIDVTRLTWNIPENYDVKNNGYVNWYLDYPNVNDGAYSVWMVWDWLTLVNSSYANGTIDGTESAWVNEVVRFNVIDFLLNADHENPNRTGVLFRIECYVYDSPIIAFFSWIEVNVNIVSGWDAYSPLVKGLIITASIIGGIALVMVILAILLKNGIITLPAFLSNIYGKMGLPSISTIPDGDVDCTLEENKNKDECK